MNPVARRRLGLSFLGFGAFFGLLPLGLKALPAIGGSAPFLLVLLAAPIAGFVLAVIGLLTALELGLARRDGDEIPPSSLRRAQIVAGGLLALLICVLLLRWLPAALPTGSDRLRLDAAAWQAPRAIDAKAGQPSPRQAMLADLLPRLAGKSRAELEALLGPSLKSGYFVASGRDLIYFTGPQRDSPFGIDSEWLLIWLDGNGRYQRHAIVND
ncbi:MAG: hypothetical protein ACK4F7_02480 [Inhella sp.]